MPDNPKKPPAGQGGEPTPEERLEALLEKTIDKVLDRRAKKREEERAARHKGKEPPARDERPFLARLWDPSPPEESKE